MTLDSRSYLPIVLCGAVVAFNVFRGARRRANAARPEQAAAPRRSKAIVIFWLVLLIVTILLLVVGTPKPTNPPLKAPPGPPVHAMPADAAFTARPATPPSDTAH